MEESTLIFIKPDGLAIKPLILEILQQNGLSIKFLGMASFDEELIRLFYPLLNESVIQKCLTYMAGKDLPFYVISGPDAIQTVKRIKNELRKSHGNSRTGSIMHSSDDAAECAQEMVFFENLLSLSYA